MNAITHLTQNNIRNSVDTASFRDAMSLLASAVTIITTDGPNGRHGFTASAVSSVSDTPPTILVCVNRTSSSHAHLFAHGRLAVNILSDSHDTLSGRFATSRLSMDERFSEGDWKRGAGGLPVLGDALASLECRIADIAEVGTHTVIFGEVETINLQPGSGKALVWFRRQYAAL
ncbi:flavin reductase [Acetobacter sp. AN02]|uniref:flavin reductase n=1 Tax=Acetobacter sp. AN02 TaxID=2894186 RepID=UPI00243444E6|nr:flavin reductase [Acetobacter sp. AN02]MDG6094339.1 flavin reductase [Acetobacter sp. AN02]